MPPLGTADPETYAKQQKQIAELAAKDGFVEDFLVEIPVAWGDHDSNQHVNNVTMARWFETGRIRFISSIHRVLRDQYPGQHLDGFSKGGVGKGCILADVYLRYLRPAFYPDNVIVAHKIKEAGERKLVLESAIYSYKQGRKVCSGSATLVSFDWDAQKSHPFQKEVLEGFKDLIRKSEAISAKI